MTLPMLKQPILIPTGAILSPQAPKNDLVAASPAASDSTLRTLMRRPAGSVFARHVRWGTEDDGEKRKRIAQGARPAGLFFSTMDWSGNGGGPTEHQQAQTVEQVFGSFNWT